MSGQSIMDRVTAAKHSIAGQGLAKSVCKATTEEVMGPKKKHLDYLILCTNEPNVSIPQMADLLIERTQYLNWVVVFKSLITIHNLMNYGNERFTQYLASNNCSFNLGSFLDKGGVQGYDMSTFIRRYAKYLNEKAVSYRAMAYDFCKVKRGKDDGLLRTMNTDKLLKALPVLQQQIDILLEFDCTPNDLTNGVINASFMLMFKDLIRLFACYNDGIINLLEKYFDMNKKQCKEALDIYKKFLVRMDKVSEFLKVAELDKGTQIRKRSLLKALRKSASQVFSASLRDTGIGKANTASCDLCSVQQIEGLKNVGIDKGDIPDLAKGKNNSFGERITSAIGLAQKIAPASLLDALEQHLQSLDSKKGVTPTPTTKPAGFTSAINTMQSNSNNMDISEEEKKKILDEENKTLQQLKEQKLKETKQSPVSTPQSQTVAASSNPFATSTQTPPAPAQSKPSDDLLNLTGNPFVESVQSIMNAQPTMNTMHAPNPFGAPVWGAQQTSFFPTQPMYPYGYTAQQQQQSRAGFTSDADFDKVFNNTSGAKVAVLDVSTGLTPAQHQPKSSTVPSAPTEKESGFDFLNPFSGGTKDTTKSFPPSDFATWGPIEGVDNVFGDLVVGSAPAQAFDVFGEVLQPISQSGKPAEQKKAKPITDDLDSSLVQLAGSLSVKEAKNKQYEWQPKGEQKKTGGEKWTAQPMASSTWSMGYPQQPVVGGMMSAPMQVPQPMVRVNQPMGMPAMGMAPMGVMGMGMAQPVMYGAIRPGMPPMGMAQPRPPHSQPNDPFGAL